MRRSFAVAAALLTALPLCGSAAPQTRADAFAAFDRLLGTWTGTSEGRPGKGTLERTYERVLGSRFIQVRNRNVYPPQEANPKGEVHEDVGFISFDSARKQILFRQFHVEGFVISYALQAGTGTDRMVFVSEAIENIPAGYQSRETYAFTGVDQFEEVFEIAAPGKDFEVYSRARLRRAR